MTTEKSKRKKQILELLQKHPAKYAELRELARASLPIEELIDEGLIEKSGLGVYSLVSADATWNSLKVLTLRYPSAVICLQSAAAFHELATVNPGEVYAAFPYGKVSIPTADDLSIRGFRWRGPAMEVGIEKRDLGGVLVNITTPERTVVDLLRTRTKTGEVELAMEALRNLTNTGGNMDEVLKISEKLGCQNQIRPFTEAANGFRP